MQQGKLGKRDETAEAMRVQADLLHRFADIREFMIARGVVTYVPVFTAIDPTLHKYADRMRKLWTGDVRMSDDDGVMISKMENVVEHLKAA